jgi:hypothetical protein
MTMTLKALPGPTASLLIMSGISKHRKENIRRSNTGAKSTLLLIALGLLLLIIFLSVYLLDFLKENGYLIPDYASFTNKEGSYLIDDENISICLKHKKLTIEDNDSGDVLYESPKEWKISDYFYFDADNDEENEVMLVVWKKGSYGEHRPFWDDSPDNDWTIHLFIYDWDSERADRLDPRWMSSEIGRRVTAVSVDEENRIHLIDDSGGETVWKWYTWGLVLEEENQQ